MRTLALVAGLILADAASAQTNVYKCVDGAHPVYQQTPCQGRAQWRWEVPAAESLPRSAPSPGPRAVRSKRGRAGPAAATRARTAAAQGALIAISADPAACARARQRRAELLGKGHRLDFLQRRQLDDAVFDACR